MACGKCGHEGHNRTTCPAKKRSRRDGPIFDEDIPKARLDMVRSAQSSIDITSLTFPDVDLIAALEEAADAGVNVRLVVADRTIRRKHHEAIDRLVDAGAE